MIVVADSGPLIHLSRIGHLTLLPTLFRSVHVPRQVFDEVVVDGAGLPGSEQLAEAGWINVVEGAPQAEEALLLSHLDRGEVAAIAVAIGEANQADR